jgi:GNAT superfamily N-acetyltransferase
MTDASTERVVVRDAVAGDVGDLLELLAELHPRYPGDPSRSAAILSEILGSRGRSLLVAGVDGVVLGTADLIVVANLSHEGAPWAIVENVVVRPHARGAGVGRALLDEILRRANADGCYMVQLLSLEHRLEAHAFYRRLGFEPAAQGFRVYLDGFAATTAPDTNAVPPVHESGGTPDSP